MESKSQLTEAKRKNEEEAEVITRLEENRKKSMKDLEELTHKLEEVQAANDKLEKSKRKLELHTFFFPCQTDGCNKLIVMIWRENKLRKKGLISAQNLATGNGSQT